MTETNAPVIDQTKPPVVGQQVWWIEYSVDGDRIPEIQTGIVSEATTYDCYVGTKPYKREYMSRNRIENLYYYQQEAEDKLVLYKNKLEKVKRIERANLIWKIIVGILSIASVVLAFVYLYQYPKIFIQDMFIFLAPYIGFLSVTLFILYIVISIFIALIDAIEKSERRA